MLLNVKKSQIIEWSVGNLAYLLQVLALLLLLPLPLRTE